MKRPALASLLLLASLHPSHAAFEKWTNKDGKTAEMEISGFSGSGTDTQVHFKTRASKEISLALSDLSTADQVRARKWRPRFETRYLKSDLDDSNISFSFDVAAPGFIGAAKTPVEVKRFTLGAGTITATDWSGGISQDPFASEVPLKGSNLVIRAKIDPAKLDERSIDRTDLEATLYMQQGGTPKELTATFDLPTGMSDRKFQELGPFRVALIGRPKPSDSPFGKPVDAGKKIEEYAVVVAEDDPRIISQTIVAGGKDYTDSVEVAKANGPVKVIIKYWSEVREVPVTLTKKPGQKPLIAAPK
jgi:hypothetical protein